MITRGWKQLEMPIMFKGHRVIIIAALIAGTKFVTFLCSLRTKYNYRRHAPLRAYQSNKKIVLPLVPDWLSRIGISRTHLHGSRADEERRVV